MQVPYFMPPLPVERGSLVARDTPPAPSLVILWYLCARNVPVPEEMHARPGPWSPSRPRSEHRHLCKVCLPR